MTRYMVTGGAGFLGASVTRMLQRVGHEVFVPRSRDYDLRDAEAIERALADGAPDVVVHLAAAVGGIGANVAEPGRFFYDNALMGIQLMERARQFGVAKFVTVGTVCEYPRDAALPFREDDIWSGYPAPETAPYALAKKMLLVQAQAYRKQYGFDSIHLIPVNLYGPGDNFDVASGHVVAGLIRKFSEAIHNGAATVVCWGSGRATREFLYVEDAARGIVQATRLYSGAEPVNIGTGVETSVAELVRRISDIYGFTGTILWDPLRPDGQPQRQLDVSRAYWKFGFKAITDLNEGLRNTIDWFEAQEGVS